MHNTRIERLWYDVTNGFGRKWKTFFLDLETNHGLEPSNPAHIWLLHHLFLAAVHQDAQDWANGWNCHTLQLRHQRNRSPRDLFFFGMYQEGLRGHLPTPVQGSSSRVDEDLAEEDWASYGIDWEVIDDETLMTHHRTANPTDSQSADPFAPATTPSNLAHVPCEPPNSPLTPEEITWLDARLAERVDRSTRSMTIERAAWIEALALSSEVWRRRARA